MRSENQELTDLLLAALNNAERIFIAKNKSFIPYDYEPNDQDLFKIWAYSFWGITLGEKRTSVTYPIGEPITSFDYWTVVSVKDEEQMIMFKLKYG